MHRASTTVSERPCGPTRWLLVPPHLVMVLLGVAGVLKLLDMDGFRQSLETWELVPSPIRIAAAMLVPTIEMALFLVWLSGYRRRLAALCAITLLACFAGVFAVHIVLVEPPECSCFGLLRRYGARREQAALVLLRDAVMLAGLLPALLRRGNA